MEIDNIDSGSGDEQVIPVIGKRVNVTMLAESIAIILRRLGSLHDTRELSPTEAQQIDLYQDNIFCFKNIKKNKFEYVRYPSSSRNLKIFKVTRGGGGGGGGGKDGKAGNISQAYIMNVASPSAQQTLIEAVNITNPKNESIVERGRYGVFTDGSAFVAKSVKLDWGSGGDTVTVADEYWKINNLPLAPDEYTLNSEVSGDSSTVSFTVILKPAIVGYTAEEIQAVMNDRPGHPQQTPTKSGYIAADAGLLTQDEPLVKQGVHINEVKALASAASGDYNLFYSGSGDQAFIEKRIDFIFGKNLSAETKTTLVNDLLKEKKPGFMDATNAYHEAMNKTLELYFTENSFEEFVSNMESPKFYFDPVGFVMAEAVKGALHLKLNAHLMNSSNGAPRLMQQDAKKFVFIFVATSVVGSGFGGVALKIGGKASRASKSYLSKYNHKFTRLNKGKHSKRLNLKSIKASKANESFPSSYMPPYKPGTMVKEYDTATEEIYVQVHLAGKSGGRWMMKEEAIQGLTAKQIKSKYALPELPTHITEVHVPAGTPIRTGTVNPIKFKEGDTVVGEAIQYQTLKRIPVSSYKNTKRL